MNADVPGMICLIKKAELLWSMKASSQEVACAKGGHVNASKE